MNSLRRLHARLLPAAPSPNWLPYIWLAYLSFLIVPFWYRSPTAFQVAATVLSVVVFLPLYFQAHWVHGRGVLVYIAAITLIGVALLPINASAHTYFIYAACFAATAGPPKRAVQIIVLIISLLVLEALLFNIPIVIAFIGGGIGLIVGIANVFYVANERKNRALRQSQAQTKRFAQIAERERIARDLHDLLGHSLSVIALKAELARRLLSAGQAAKTEDELRELERCARTALKEVRDAVSGYRDIGWPAACDRVRDALSAAGIHLHWNADDPVPPVGLQDTLTMIVREAVTNVIRHADAAHCRITTRQGEDVFVLEVIDDGVGTTADTAAGSGMKGMRERLQDGGGLQVIAARGGGTRLIASLPMRQGQSESAVSRDARLPAAAATVTR